MSELHQSSHLHNEASVHINPTCLLDIYDAYLRFFNKNLILRFDPHRGPGSPESRVFANSIFVEKSTLPNRAGFLIWCSGEVG